MLYKVYKREKPVILTLFLFLIFLLLQCCSSPVPSGEDYSEINILEDPVQIPYKGEPIMRVMKDCTYTLSPVAGYRMSAMVVGKKSYSDGWRGEVAPVDLALAWGKLAEPESKRYVKYRQSDRWYFYEYKPDSPFNNSYIINHSSNNHVIPADGNILKAIKSIKKKDKIVLEGYLVNVRGSYEGNTLWWNSSVRRSDTGDGSCEVFYVTKVRVRNTVYE